MSLIIWPCCIFSAFSAPYYVSVPYSLLQCSLLHKFEKTSATDLKKNKTEFRPKFWVITWRRAVGVFIWTGFFQFSWTIFSLSYIDLKKFKIFFFSETNFPVFHFLSNVGTYDALIFVRFHHNDAKETGLLMRFRNSKRMSDIFRNDELLFTSPFY